MSRVLERKTDQEVRIFLENGLFLFDCTREEFLEPRSTSTMITIQQLGSNFDLLKKKVLEGEEVSPRRTLWRPEDGERSLELVNQLITPLNFPAIGIDEEKAGKYIDCSNLQIAVAMMLTVWSERCTTQGKDSPNLKLEVLF